MFYIIIICDKKGAYSVSEKQKEIRDIDVKWRIAKVDYERAKEEAENGTVSVRSRDTGETKTMSLDDFLSHIRAEIAQRIWPFKSDIRTIFANALQRNI